MKPHFAICLSLALLLSGRAAAEPSSAAMISDFRLKHGEGRVTMDATLVRIAPAKAGRAAENIAYGYDGFEKTLDQWIASSGHLKNLLLPKASRVGVASARSAATHRTYWAMEIAGDYEPPPAASKRAPRAARGKPAVQSCRAKILGICF